jgi:hypothetical protein
MLNSAVLLNHISNISYELLFKYEDFIVIKFILLHTYFILFHTSKEALISARRYLRNTSLSLLKFKGIIA